MNIFSTSQYLIGRGIPEEILILLLMLPIVATIIAFARQVIGIKGFDIYTPLIITFAFLLTGLRYGLILFALILVVGTISRLIVKKFRLLYLPRMAIILTSVSTIVLLSFYLNNYFNLIKFNIPSVFIVLAMIALIEKFIVIQIERGIRGSILLAVEITILSIISFYVISWGWLENIVLTYPLLIIALTVAINLFLGKWTGLRLTEYFRFKDVIKNVELPGKK